jgi:hypothetical protein
METQLRIGGANWLSPLLIPASAFRGRFELPYSFQSRRKIEQAGGSERLRIAHSLKHVASIGLSFLLRRGGGFMDSRRGCRSLKGLAEAREAEKKVKPPVAYLPLNLSFAHK